MENVLVNYFVNFHPNQKNHQAKYILSWSPYSKDVYKQIAKNNGTTEQDLKNQIVNTRDRKNVGDRVPTKYFDLPTEVMEEYAQTLDELTGARRWFAPKKTSDCLSTIMSGVLFIVRGVQSAHIGHIFDTGDVLYEASTIPPSVPLPAGFFGTAVRRELPCKSTGYIIGNTANVAESTLLVTLEHISTLQNPTRYDDIIQLARVYKALGWCPTISVKSLETGNLQVVYPEDDGSVMDVLHNRHVYIQHLEVYIYRDLLRYIFDLAQVGYRLTTWSDADWRISQWNVPSRQIILVSTQHLELLPQSTPKECFRNSLKILLEMFSTVVEYRQMDHRKKNYAKFQSRLLRKDQHQEEHLYNHLHSLHRPQYRQQKLINRNGYIPLDTFEIEHYQHTTSVNDGLVEQPVYDHDEVEKVPSPNWSDPDKHIFDNVDDHVPGFFSSPIRFAVGDDDDEFWSSPIQFDVGDRFS